MGVVEPTGQIHMDQTGQFPYPSSRGYQYIMVLYDYNSNVILVEPIKNKKAESILNAFKILRE